MLDSQLPRPGDRYRARVDTPVRLWIVYAAPGTGSANGVFPRGEVLKIQSVPPGAGWAFALPERNELETVLVPKEERDCPTYGGYAVIVQLDSLAKDFERMAAG